MMMGPNEKKLIFKKFAKDAIPDDGSVLDGFRALADPDMPAKMKMAALCVKGALDMLMLAPDCIYENREEAAQAVLDKI
jgi:hypothetical protein